MTDLSTLLARVEAGSGADREIDAAVACALAGFWPDLTPFPCRDGTIWRVDFCCRDEYGGRVQPGGGGLEMVPAYTTDLNAVIALVEARLPGWGWNVGASYYPEDGAFVARVWPGSGRLRDGTGNVHATEPARALLAALLRAEMERQT